MSHKELIKSVASRTCLSVPQTAGVVNCLLEVLVTELRTSGEVSLKGVGKLVLYHQSARLGRNPKTGETVMIPERQGVRFKRSKMLVL